MTKRYFALLAGVVIAISSAFAQAPGAAKQAPATTEQPIGTRTKRESVRKAPAQARTQGQPWNQIVIPPLPAFKPQQPTRIQLPNGMVIFLQEDHELPLIGLSATIRGGSRIEPASRVGLVDMYGEVWRTGGTKAKTGDQLDDFLEARAAKVETGGDVDSTDIGLDCLKADFDDVFALWLDLLRNPAFRADKLELAKRGMETVIARRNDDPDSIIGREAAVIAYGRNNPYARYPEYSTIAAVSQQDLVEWHQRFVHPNNMIVGVVGDFDSKTMEAKLRQAFESWQRGPQATEPKIEFVPPKPAMYFVPKEDVNQSSIRMVALGIRRDNPDYFALTVMNEIFGGGFSSRLFKNIRTKKGLAYSVGGGVGSAYDHPGLITLGMGTKTTSTTESIQALFDEMADMTKNPPSQEELKLAKDSILNAFVFRYDTPEKVLREQMALEFYGYPKDFLEQYRKGVEKATTADVARVAQKYLHPTDLAVLVVGQPEAKTLIAKLGPVSTLDITIPPPPGQQTAVAANAPKGPANSPEARALLEKVVQAVGDPQKLASVNSIEQVISATQQTPQGPMQLQINRTVVFPDRMVTNIQTPMGLVKQVVTPQAAFMSIPGQGVRDLPASMKSEYMSSIRRDLIFVAQHANDPKLNVAIGGTAKVGDAEAQVLSIDLDGASMTWFVDPQSGRILRVSYMGTGQTGAPAERVSDFGDWKNFEGVNLPAKMTVLENGQQTTSLEVTKVQFNPQVDPKAFEKPAQAAQ